MLASYKIWQSQMFITVQWSQNMLSKWNIIKWVILPYSKQMNLINYDWKLKTIIITKIIRKNKKKKLIYKY